MPFILLAIVAIAAIVVAGMSAVHGPTIVTTGPATITSSGNELLTWGWLLIIAVIIICGWWLFRRRKQ